MADTVENANMALFCDFENIALGVKDANYAKFDIAVVLDRLLLKGKIVVKKAYCDWARYKEFKPPMHEASFELIEIPHLRQSGKNSADIRMVVDALDLCYMKSHVDTFVIISGDSDFSPLASKLRENNKTVIGVGVKSSTSDLLVKNCDEFIFYEDLVRPIPQIKKAQAKPSTQNKARQVDPGSAKTAPEKMGEAFNLIVTTCAPLLQDRGDEWIWASSLKQALKRRMPSFTESQYGFKTFKQLLEAAESAGHITLNRDNPSLMIKLNQSN